MMNTNKKIKSKITFCELCKQNQLYILAFALPFFIMLFLYVIKRIYPFGDQSFLYSDLQHQYYPFLLEFQRKLQAGESLTYSWNDGLGSNFITLFAYYLASPFNWLCVFVPETYLGEFISYMVIFKIGLCGLTSCIYFSCHFKTKRRVLALFSLFYALSGYMAAYNWNIMWLDCLFLAPLIILGLEELVNTGKYKLYCICLGLSILSNYYLSIMICIYLVLYFFIVLFPVAKEKLAAFIRFAIFSLLSGGLAGALLYPCIVAIPYSARTVTAFPTSLEVYSNPFEVMARHFMNVGVTTLEYWPYYWPNIYCSVAVFILFPLYVLNSNIKIKDKLGKIILVIILLLSYSFNITSYLWHGFTYPKALPARQSFLYILLLLTVCLDSFMHLRTINKKKVFLTYTSMFVFVFLAWKFVTYESFTPEVFLSTFGFLAIYACFLYIFLYTRISISYLPYLLAVMVIAEATGNTMATSLPTTLRATNLQTDNTFHKLSELRKEKDNGKFYRYDKIERFSNNDSLLQDYPSLSLFTSTGSKLLNNYYKRYGMRGENVHITTEGSTPFIYGLLSGGYTFSNTRLHDDTFYEEVAIENNVCLYKNTFSVPLGFCIASDEVDESTLVSNMTTSLSAPTGGDGLSALDRQNLLACRLGAPGTLFEKLESTDDIRHSTFQVEKDSYVYIVMDTAEFLEVSVSVNNEPTSTLKEAYTKFVRGLGYQAADSTITLNVERDNTNARYYSNSFDGKLKLSAYSLNLDCLEELMNKLNQNTLIVDSMTSGSLSGNVTAAKDGYLVLSVPSDPGFTVMVDNVETESLVFDNMMIAIPITAGDHTISLEYYPPGLNTGIAISLCSLSIFIVICILDMRNSQKRRLNPPISDN